MSPPSFNDNQIAALLDAAQRVPRMWRGRFLENVVDRLLVCGTPTDEQIAEAIGRVANRIGVNIEECASGGISRIHD